MKPKILRGTLLILSAAVLPFMTLAIFGLLYVIVNMMSGTSFTLSLQSFMHFIDQLKPYFPYMTALPLLAGLVIVLLRKRAIG